MTEKAPKVAVIGMGGTIQSMGTGPFDLLDYVANKTMLSVEELIAAFPVVQGCADVLVVNYKAVPSSEIFFDDWKNVVQLIERLSLEEPDLAGFVITHGTATLEETAYFLTLCASTALPIVVTGSQRPVSGLSTDAPINLANAIRTAASPEARGLGVLVLLNDEIHSARDVAKTSTFRLHAFRSPDFGILGHADADRISFYRKPVKRHYPDTEFDIRQIDALPRVDIVYAYAGSDGTASRAYIDAGARGIVSAGFAPGTAGAKDEDVLKRAVREQNLVVVQSSRAGSGRTSRGIRFRENGILSADNLTPQKARLLLALALTVTDDPKHIQEMFESY